MVQLRQHYLIVVVIGLVLLGLLSLPWFVIIVISGLFGFVCSYYWKQKLNLVAYIPNIDWSMPRMSSIPVDWSDIQYPSMPQRTVDQPNVIGRSGAWKDVQHMIATFPALRSVQNPEELRVISDTYQADALTLINNTIISASNLVNDRHVEYLDSLKQLPVIHQGVEDRIRSVLDKFKVDIKTQEAGNFWGRCRAKRLKAVLVAAELRLAVHTHIIRNQAQETQQSIIDFLNPEFRSSMIFAQFQGDMVRIRSIIQSKEYVGAVAEYAVIQELRQLPANHLVINDLRLKAPKFIYNNGKPIQSAQIDTLVISPAGVFVIEVKNWSREFAKSGIGFCPYTQVNRARRLVDVVLHESHINVKVRAIVVSMCSLPDQGDAVVAVKSIQQLRSYITWFDPANVDVRNVFKAISHYQETKL